MMGARLWSLLVILAVLGNAWAGEVTYDHRSLIINGQRKILFAGSIHYPRSTPEMWPSLISKAKDGGIDVIDTYVFWNLHEPQPGQYDFSGSRDIVGFIKEVEAQGLYACLRIGPFIQAEWSYGGLPFWLHDIPGIVFRTDNEPFKAHMQNFTTKIVNMMQSQNLYASQGGPIILSQIENEYGMVEHNYPDEGPIYVRWAAQMAVGLQTGVPWVMCKQPDAPNPVINTCNGMRCGETFSGPNSPEKPSIWTENWTTRYEVYGVDKPPRPIEDLAFQVALFIAKNGSFVNYYMYHGGTNFGRSASAFTTTSYYDLAPIDEYGLLRQPKWGHLKELHAAIKLCMTPLLFGVQQNIFLGQLQQAYVFNGQAGECVAFLINNDITNGASVHFQDGFYDLPQKSISILPDCKNVVFNTAKVSTQFNTRTMTKDKVFDSKFLWSEYKEVIPNFDGTTIRSDTILEQMNATKDTSDYLWYTLRLQNNTSNTQVILNVSSLGHLLHAFVNGQKIGFSQGSYQSPRFNLVTTMSFNSEVVNLSLLSVMVGFPDAGAYLESKAAGLKSVTIENVDYTNHPWGYQIGLRGETLQIYTDQGSSQIQWKNFSNAGNQLVWYKTHFDAPLADVPTALNLGSMGKGEAWINGQSIGRYWPSYRSPSGSSKVWYHVPRSFLKPTGNLLVLLEEEGGDPLQVSVDTISISQVCGHVAASDLPPVSTWQNNPDMKNSGSRRPKVWLSCPANKVIAHILFASYGTPTGGCGSTFGIGSCHSRYSSAIVKKACLGRMNCSIPISSQFFGGDPCPTDKKSLLVVAECK